MSDLYYIDPDGKLASGKAFPTKLFPIPTHITTGNEPFEITRETAVWVWNLGSPEKRRKLLGFYELHGHSFVVVQLQYSIEYFHPGYDRAYAMSNFTYTPLLVNHNLCLGNYIYAEIPVYRTEFLDNKYSRDVDNFTQALLEGDDEGAGIYARVQASVQRRLFSTWVCNNAFADLRPYLQEHVTIFDEKLAYINGLVAQ